VCCGMVPEPVRDSVAGELDALLAKVTLAETAPEAWGAKVSWNETLVPAGMVTGRLIPLAENCDPLTPSEDTVTAAPLALRVAF